MPKGFSIRNQGGWKHAEKSKSLMSERRSGITSNEKNPRWKGNNVTYSALHNWVRAHFKKPSACEKCGIKPGVDARGHTKIHWANKTKKYLRERTDWLALCVKCHRQYDLANKKKHRYAK